MISLNSVPMLKRARDLNRSTVIGKGITKARMAKETHEGPLLLIKARQR